MKIVGRTQMLSQYSILASLDVIKRLGFDGVEICVERKDWSLHDLRTMPVEAIRRRIAELELTPHSFSLHQDYLFDDHLFELTQEAIKLAPHLGATCLCLAVQKREKETRLNGHACLNELACW
jgi:sugar phosphate isomerase/epimerase